MMFREEYLMIRHKRYHSKPTKRARICENPTHNAPACANQRYTSFDQRHIRKINWCHVITLKHMPHEVLRYRVDVSTWGHKHFSECKFGRRGGGNEVLTQHSQCRLAGGWKRLLDRSG